MVLSPEITSANHAQCIGRESVTAKLPDSLVSISLEPIATRWLLRNGIFCYCHWWSAHYPAWSTDQVGKLSFGQTISTATGCSGASFKSI